MELELSIVDGDGARVASCGGEGSHGDSNSCQRFGMGFPASVIRNPHELGPSLSRRPINSFSSKEHTQGSDGMLNEYHVPVEWGHDGLGWYGNNWGMTCLVQ